MDGRRDDLIERAEGVTLDEVAAKTQASFTISPLLVG